MNMGMEHRGTSAGPPPWDVGRPQPAVAELVASGAFSGLVLDTGCGRGEHALLLAASGLEVVGLDLNASALRDAERKARELGLDARTRFLRFNLRDLAALGEVLDTAFDTALDSLVFHAFEGDARREYVAGLRSALRSGGRLYVLCYSDRHTGTPDVPHKVSLTDLDQAFADGWTVDEVRATTSMSNLHPGGVAAWLVACTRR